ncbi:hypothetical protein ACHAQA_003162 [Verticillium albo-atrum]
MNSKPYVPAKNEIPTPNRLHRRSKRRSKPASSNPSSCSSYLTQGSSKHHSHGTTHTQATTAHSHRQQQGSTVGKRNPDRTAGRHADAPGQGLVSGRKMASHHHLTMTPAREQPAQGKNSTYVPAVPEAEIPSHVDFVNDPAHAFWTWSQKEQGWYHEDKEAGSVIWAPEELD